MLLALAFAAHAEDLHLVVVYDDQSWESTLSDVHAGRIPSMVLDDGDHELRIDLVFSKFSATELSFDFIATRTPDKGGRGEVLWKGTVSGGGAQLPAFMSTSNEHSFQLMAATDHPVAPIATGPLAGCQFARQSGMTDVQCPDANLRHHVVDHIAYDEIEAGVARAKSAPGISVQSGPTKLSVSGASVDGYRVNVSSGGSPPNINLIAWMGPTAKDEVRCQSDAEEVCLRYFSAFTAGLPLSLQ
jgi:hypothetical protein